MTETVPKAGIGHPRLVRTIKDMRACVDHWHAKGRRVGLVPTMGALHHGHLSLVGAIAAHVDHVIVSIFVNPTQFGPNEDFERYPRHEAQDLAALGDTAADLVFIPTVAEMYPQGFASSVHVAGITDMLEGAERPGHFDAVATVVLKLLMQSRTDAAIFGEKDYQQLAVIRQMVADLDLPVDILAAPIVREADGLAASSRNVYLTAPQRQVAGRMNHILHDLKKRAEAGDDLATLEQDGKTALLSAGFDAVDYLCFRDALSLSPVGNLKKPVRLLAVARLGGIRLLDNLAVGEGSVTSKAESPA